MPRRKSECLSAFNFLHGDKVVWLELIPACETLITMHLTSSSEGRFSRRREAGRGAVSPRVGLRRPDTRGGAGLPPGPLRGPARSWLTTLRPTPNASRPVDMVRAGKRGKERRKRGRRTDSRRNGAPRGARASFAGRDTIGLRLYRFASFGAPSPSCLEGATFIDRTPDSAAATKLCALFHSSCPDLIRIQ